MIKDSKRVKKHRKLRKTGIFGSGCGEASDGNATERRIRGTPG